MIQANAKCINNGKKLNETIGVLNNILKVVVSEEIEIVDSNNQPSKRWFFTGKLTGQKQDSDTGGKDRYGNTPSNNNRDQLSMNTGGALRDSGGGVAPTGNVTGVASDSRVGVNSAGFDMGGPSGVASDSRVGVNDAGFDMGGPSGVASDSRLGVNDAGFDMGGGTMPPPLPGAPPQISDTTPAPLPGAPPQISDTTPPPLPGAPPPNQPATSTQADAAPPSSAANTNITKMEDELRIAQEKLRSLKRTNNKELNPSTGYYDYSHVPAITSQQRLVDELKRQVAAARA